MGLRTTPSPLILCDKSVIFVSVDKGQNYKKKSFFSIMRSGKPNGAESFKGTNFTKLFPLF